MINLEDEVEVNEALFNIGKLAGRIPTDEGKRLVMLSSTVVKYKKQLEKRIEVLEEYVQQLEQSLNKHESPPTKRQLQAEIARLKGE
jgi:hypothetical protein